MPCTSKPKIPRGLAIADLLSPVTPEKKRSPELTRDQKIEIRALHRYAIKAPGATEWQKITCWAWRIQCHGGYRPSSKQRGPVPSTRYYYKCCCWLRYHYLWNLSFKHSGRCGLCHWPNLWDPCIGVYVGVTRRREAQLQRAQAGEVNVRPEGTPSGRRCLYTGTPLWPALALWPALPSGRRCPLDGTSHLAGTALLTAPAIWLALPFWLAPARGRRLHKGQHLLEGQRLHRGQRLLERAAPAQRAVPARGQRLQRKQHLPKGNAYGEGWCLLEGPCLYRGQCLLEGVPTRW